jgi:hypothetical protein
MRYRSLLKPPRFIGFLTLTYGLCEVFAICLIFRLAPTYLDTYNSESLCEFVVLIAAGTSIQLLILLLDELWIFHGMAGINRHPAYVSAGLHSGISISGLIAAWHYIAV